MDADLILGNYQHLCYCASIEPSIRAGAYERVRCLVMVVGRELFAVHKSNFDDIFEKWRRNQVKVAEHRWKWAEDMDLEMEEFLGYVSEIRRQTSNPK